MQDYVFISTFCGALVLAFVFGFAAHRLKLSPILGYLLAGVAVGPFTPGFVGDANLALQMAEIGVILLMFGVGLKFSLADLWSVRGIAIPGAIVQMSAATGLGYLVGQWMGLPAAESVMLGFSLSVASTVVLLRALEERKIVKSENGRICVGWLVVEDIAIIFAIVVLPLFSPLGRGEPLELAQLGSAMALTLIKVGVFVALMLVVGGRVFPWLIVRVAHTKSRELMSLGTIALALGVAFIAYFMFQASFALGAFLAGVVLNGTKFTHRVAEDSQPLRDTFAVLFFVSVGMLFDPMTIIKYPLGVLAVVAIIVLGKGLAAYGIAKLFRRPTETALIVAIALAQIGEFSFVLAGMGLSLDLMSRDTYNLVLGGAIISIGLNPFLFKLIGREPKGPHADVEEVKPA